MAARGMTPGVVLACLVAAGTLSTAAPAAAHLLALHQSREAQPVRASQAQPVRTTQPAQQTQTRPGAGTPAAASQPQPAAPPPPPPSAAPTEASRALLRLDQLETQQRELTDRIERLEALVGRLEAENLRLRAAAVQAAVPAVPEAADAADTASPAAGEAPAPGESASASTSQPATPASAPTSATPTSRPQTASPGPGQTPAPGVARTAPASTSAANIQIPDEPAVVMLSAARTDLQVGAYDRAEARLIRLLELWPEASETGEGRWLLGETRYVTRAWAPATDAYVGYLRAVPNGPRTPDVLLRLAATFRELGDQRQRCMALDRFTRAAPNPSPALRARADAEIARGPCPPPAAR